MFGLVIKMLVGASVSQIRMIEFNSTPADTDPVGLVEQQLMAQVIGYLLFMWEIRIALNFDASPIQHGHLKRLTNGGSSQKCIPCPHLPNIYIYLNKSSIVIFTQTTVVKLAH